MKLYKYLPLLALGAMTLASCSEDPEIPPVNGPVAALAGQENINIKDFKQLFWQDGSNYVTHVENNDANEPYVIKAQVISSDESGNIYKALVVKDDSGEAMTLSINKTKLYQSYRPGQTVYIKATGLCAGGYNGLFQLGGEGTYNGQPSMTFMTEDAATANVQADGWPAADGLKGLAIETTVEEVMAAKSSAAGLQQWQSQLVKIDGLTFENAGEQFAPSANTNRYMKDASGNRINLRCSQYADFAKATIPSGTGSVTAILSYYGNDWQLLLNSIDGLEGFGEIVNPDQPDEPDQPDIPDTPEQKGTLDNPYSVADVLQLGNPGAEAWVEGVIIGVLNYENNSNLETDANTTVSTNIAIAAAADETDKANCVAVALPVGVIRDALNLKDNPGNIGKTVKLHGKLQKYFGINGIKEVTEAYLDGIQIGGSSDTPSEGDGSFTLATSVTSGGLYAFYASGKVATPLDAAKTYGYLQVVDATAADGKLTTDAANAFTLTQTNDGWTIQGADGRYVFMTGTYNSINVSSNLPSGDNGYFWDITVDSEGVATITNKGTSKVMQYDSQYNSYGFYSDSRGTKPTLYQLAK